MPYGGSIMNAQWIKAVFYLSAIYDAILAVAVLFFWQSIYTMFGVTPPNHPGYLQSPALVVLIFAAIFYRIAREPLRNRDLIPYGIALKLSYSGVVFWHSLSGGIPAMWHPFAWADAVFLALFIVAWIKLGHADGTPSAA